MFAFHYVLSTTLGKLELLLCCTDNKSLNSEAYFYFLLILNKTEKTWYRVG